MLPSPADLHYFLEVAQRLNLSRAAETLGISQPSLTLAMQRLEHCVGTPILIRNKRGVQLTQAGKQLLAHARQLIAQWELIYTQTRAAVHEVEGCFTLGCHTSIGICALPRFLNELMEQYPRLQIKLKHDLSRKITEQVLNFHVDIGIVVNPIRHPDLIIKPLGGDTVGLWHSDHQYQILDLYSNQAVLLCDPELTQTQVILKSLKKKNITFNRIIPSDNLELIAELAKSGAGIAILPASIANLRHLSMIPDMPTYQDEVTLLYRGENRDVKAIQMITRMIAAAFQHQAKPAA
jgi:LysR family transcriptional regulator, cell division regulator